MNNQSRLNLPIFGDAIQLLVIYSRPANFQCPTGAKYERIHINASLLIEELDQALDAYLYRNIGWPLQIIIGTDVIQKLACKPLLDDVLSFLHVDFSFSHNDETIPCMILGQVKGILVAPLPKGYSKCR